MSAQINFFGGESSIQNLAGSGLGFFGSAGFGASVQVGSWQGRTFITDGNGVNQGPECWNVQYLNIQSGIIGQVGTGVALTAIPNDQCPLNIRFTYDTPCQVQSAYISIYDRTTPTNQASGVTTATAQIIHPDPTQANNGSGDHTWTIWSGIASVTGQVMNLANSPGVSGLYAGNGSNSTHTDTQHDWYVAMSSSPNSIGSKNSYGLYVFTEFL